MISDGNHCVQCGGIRVAGSTLCAVCLVKERVFLEKEILIKGVAIEMLREKLETQTGRLQDALDYGFRKNQENMRLLKYTKGLCGKIREVMEDGKDGETESKNGKV